MDLDLETGYLMSNMENIDIMSLLLNIYIRYLLLLLLQHFVVIYIDCAISSSRFSQQSESHSQSWEHYQQHFTGYRVII